ncbi:20952_t:CDS:2 [Entrophospora sp. SA101]|nr:20952_t:CDS:2 [Entrophospora sp. SA101]
MEWLRLKRIDKLDSFIGCQNLDRLDEYVRIIKKLKKIHDELNESHLIELNNYLEARKLDEPTKLLFNDMKKKLYKLEKVREDIGQILITEDNDFSKIRVKQLKNVSDKLNNRDNCFGIEKDINAQKDYPNDPLINEYLKKETQSGKQVIEHLKNNAGRKGKDGALTRHVGDCLNDLINKLELKIGGCFI